MIKKFYQSLIPFLTLKILIFTLKFASKVLQNVEYKLAHSEYLNGKNILLDSLVELLSTLRKNITLSQETPQTKPAKTPTTEKHQITKK